MANQNLNITIRAFDKTSKALSSASAGIKKVGGALLSAKTAIVGLVGAAGFGALIKQGLAAGDSLAKTADKIGVTTEALAGMRHAAELTGVSTETMDMALQRFTRRASEAAIGTGEAKGALKELGINAEELVKLPLDVQMEQVADAMGGLSTQSDRVRIAMKLFDSEGVALVNTLGGGSEALREMISEADHLGLALSRTDTAQIEAANDAFTRAKGVITGLTNQFTVAFAPVLEAIANNFRQGALDSAEFGNTGQRVADAIVKAFARAQGAIHSLRVFAKRVHLAFAELGAYLQGKFVGALNTMINVYNKVARLLGMDQISTFASNATDGVATLRKELQAMSEIDPAANILEAYEQIKVKSRETAEAVANSKGNEEQANVSYVEKLKKLGEQEVDFANKTADEKTKFVAGHLSASMGELAKHSRKAFELQKAANIATAMMNTFTGATKMLSATPFPPLNAILVGATIAAGMAQVAAIKSQSFDGGGFTGRGSRSGGVDGKGGFHAILHPNETVVDHTKGGGTGVVINQSINISTGVQSTVRAEIANLLPQIAETTKAAVLQETARSGRYATGLRGR